MNMKKIYLIFILLLFLGIQYQCSSSKKKNKAITASKNKITLPSFAETDKPKIFSNPQTILKDPNQSIADRRSAAIQMVAEDTVGTAKHLLDACQSEAKIMSVEVINYFGEKYYHKAVGLLQELLKTNEDPQIIYASIFALLQMELPKINDYIINFCENSTGPTRYPCLLAINDTENKDIKKIAIPIFKNIIVNPKLETNEIIALANNFVKENQEILRNMERRTYENNTGVAKTEQIQQETFSKKKAKNIAKKIPKTKKKFSQNRVVAKKGSHRKYSRRLWYALENTGLQNSRAILNKLDRSLKQHSKGNNIYTQFLIQAYQQRFRSKKKKLNTARIRKLLGKGVRLNGSLSAIIQYTKKQYKSKRLQIYALSTALRITRKEARYVIRLPHTI